MARLYLYPRGPKPTWYIGGFPTGKKQRSTGFAGQAAKTKAEKLLAVEQKTLDVQAAKDGVLGPLTVERWAAMWLAALRAPGESLYTEYESLLDNHILPVIGRVELVDLTYEHIIKVLDAVRELAPRTRRNVYGKLKQMLRKAVPKHIPVNPCLEVEAEHQKHLPPNEDHDPEWRAGAIFTRSELELILFDERIPEDRRVYYSLLFLLGTRLSEVSALKVTAYRPVPQVLPLGKMVIAFSFSSARRVIKRTKTKVTREVPVHGLLAGVLKEWLAPGGGRERLVAMAPGKDIDLIVPSREGGCRRRNSVYAAMQRDLTLVGLRPRRVHDTRRTFISLAMEAGGHKDLLKWVTHGRPKSGDAFDQYKEPSWGALCAEVGKLELARPAGDAGVVPMRKYAVSGGDHLHAAYRPEKDSEFPVVTTTMDSRRGSVQPPGQGRTKPPLSGQVNQDALLADRDLGQGGADTPHVCQAVSESRKALTALERGDVDAARAILTRLVRR